jgi:hypothetical protein
MHHIGSLIASIAFSAAQTPERGYIGRAKLLRIGGEIPRPFTVTFDYPRKQMWLKPNRNFRQPLD